MFNKSHRHVRYRSIALYKSDTCWCFLSISSSSPSTLLCFSFTFTSSSSLAWSSSSWRVTWSRGFTYTINQKPQDQQVNVSSLLLRIPSHNLEMKTNNNLPLWTLSTTANALTSNMQHNFFVKLLMHSVVAAS